MTKPAEVIDTIVVESLEHVPARLSKSCRVFCQFVQFLLAVKLSACLPTQHCKVFLFFSLLGSVAFLCVFSDVKQNDCTHLPMGCLLYSCSILNSKLLKLFKHHCLHSSMAPVLTCMKRSTSSTSFTRSTKILVTKQHFENGLFCIISRFLSN